MLLRRIIEHTKAQNWTAIVFDFVIVVVGVSIGIEVSNWNEQLAFEQRIGNPLGTAAQRRTVHALDLGKQPVHERVLLLQRDERVVVNPVVPLELDITNDAQVRNAADIATDTDLLINNAGVADFGPIEDHDFARWRTVMATNLDGVFLCSQAAAPALKKIGIASASRSEANKARAGAEHGAAIVEGMSLARDLGNLPPTAALFLIARDPAAPNPPLGAVRIPNPVFPVNLRLTDANSMMAARPISSVPEVEITARLSMNGSPMPAE